MFIIRKGIGKNSIAMLLIPVLVFTGLFSRPLTAHGDKVVLTEETYYHLDMGVQLAYSPGSSWGSGNVYGSASPLPVTTTITFGSEIEVADVYPLDSAKGRSYDFNGNTSSHNIPSGLGKGDAAYNYYYKDHVSDAMTGGSFSGSGRNVTFSYSAKLSTPEPFEVVSYGKNGNENEIYKLFGGKAALEKDQPKIAEAVAHALKAGADGTAGDNKLYLIFCPTVIAYKKYVTVGDLEARLSLPQSARQGERYAASDASIIDGSLTVDEAILEKHYGDGKWQHVDTWPGTGAPGKNTGGSVSEKEAEPCTVTYRLTVQTTDGRTGTDTKKIEITDDRIVEGTAILELPPYTYEGHPALADDLSEFIVNNVHYSARRAYEEGVASNRFLPVPSSAGRAVKESLTSANVTFSKRGNYQVTLEVKTADGKTLTDTKPIEVRKTPCIADRLGGFQKENRKQILNISVAIYPVFMSFSSM